jgi:hypothetical protein
MYYRMSQWMLDLELNPWIRVLERLTCPQLVKKFPAFYET